MTDRLPSSSDELDADIARYESMSADEIDEELRKAGIDPQQTIDAVQSLVRRKLAELKGDA